MDVQKCARLHCTDLMLRLLKLRRHKLINVHPTGSSTLVRWLWQPSLCNESRNAPQNISSYTIIIFRTLRFLGLGFYRMCLRKKINSFEAAICRIRLCENHFSTSFWWIVATTLRNVLTSVTRLGNFLKPLATIILPKSPTFLGNFCKGVKVYLFLVKSFLGNFYRHFFATIFCLDF